jgi:hypothetical protein
LVISPLLAPAGWLAAALPVRWRYHFTDFRTGRLLATLPLSGVKLTEVLGGVGSAQIRVADPFSATVPRRTVLWAERQVLDEGARRVASSRIMWSGPLLTRSRDLASRVMNLKAVSWEGYFARRLIGRDLPLPFSDTLGIARILLRDAVRQTRILPGTPAVAPVSYPPVDRISVTDQEWERLLSEGWRGRAGDTGERVYHPLAVPPATTYTSPGVPAQPPTEVPVAPQYPTVPPHLAPLDVTSGPLSNVYVDCDYLASDLKPVLEALTDLAQSSDGFDWRLDPYMGTPGDLTTLAVRSLLGYPRLGRVAPADLRWSTDRADARRRWGHIAALTLTEDGSAVNNRVTALGEGQPPDQLRAVAQSLTELDSGYPLFEGSLSSSTADNRTQQQVDAQAQGALSAQLASQLTVSGVEVRGDLAPTVDSYVLGDDATLRIGESLTGQPVTIVGQIVGRTIQPADAGGTERVTFDVQGSRAA